MRVFVTGGSGVIGSRLVSQLLEAGHDVVGTHHSPSSAEVLGALGAKPLLLDLLDVRAVREAVVEHEPDAIVHQATALANAKLSRNLDETLARTNQLRTTGTDALLAAAREVGVRRFVAQSCAPPGRYACQGGPIKSEKDLLGDPPKHMRESFAAFDHLERAVTEFGGSALRYGALYGATNDGSIEPVRKRRFPIIGDGGGIWSWTHVEDAAAASVAALDHGDGAIYNVVDDEPAPVREWLPALAQALGAQPPRHFPTWFARLVAGETAVMMFTQARGASNDRAKRELGWMPRYPSWRQGFPATYAALRLAERATSRPLHSTG